MSVHPAGVRADGDFALAPIEADRTISEFLKTWIREQDTSVWVKFAADSPNLAGVIDFSDRAGMQQAVNAGWSQSAGAELLQGIDNYRREAACTLCRRAVIMIANGGTFLGTDMYKRIEEIALRERIVLHVIDAYAGQGRYGPRGSGEAALPKSNLPAQVVTLAGSDQQSLKDLAADTGGIYIQATGKDAMRNALARLQEHLGNQYVITYFWSGLHPGPQFHSVRIQATSRDATIHAPKGYYISAE